MHYYVILANIILIYISVCCLNASMLDMEGENGILINNRTSPVQGSKLDSCIHIFMDMLDEVICPHKYLFLHMQISLYRENGIPLGSIRPLSGIQYHLPLVVVSSIQLVVSNWILNTS